jgi:hypothetical protein
VKISTKKKNEIVTLLQIRGREFHTLNKVFGMLRLNHLQTLLWNDIAFDIQDEHSILCFFPSKKVKISELNFIHNSISTKHITRFLLTITNQITHFDNNQPHHTWSHANIIIIIKKFICSKIFIFKTIWYLIYYIIYKYNKQ